MKKIIVILGVLIIGSVTFAYAMSELNGNKSYSWRYKMIVEIETPEGTKTGSAVREVTTTIKTVYYDWVDEYDTIYNSSVKGEAVVVDLGARGKVFALLNGYALGVDHAKSIASHVLYPRSNKDNMFEYMSALKDAKAALEPYQYPMLVTFTDMNDPKSVVPLLDVKQGKFLTDLTIKKDHFEEIFGQGVHLKTITIEMTDEPVTWGVGTELHWLDNLKGGYLHGGFTSKGSPMGLYGGNFRTGEK